MAAASIPADRKSARLALVQQHVQFENEHHLEGVLSTFGEHAHYQDEAWGDNYPGRDGVRSYYEQLMAALPDLQIQVRQQHVTDDHVLLEVLICGTQLGPWRGLPATGRRLEVPLCAVYTFDGEDRLAGERIYYDRATVLRQLGVFHEPQTALGLIGVLLTHPMTVAHALFRSLFSKQLPGKVAGDEL
jgi:steroid delta-isomerase-like uncharacterized protein